MGRSKLKIHEKVCPVCGKRFYMASDEWVYKRPVNGRTKVYCTWTCYRAAEPAARKRQAAHSKHGEPLLLLDCDFIFQQMDDHDLSYTALSRRSGFKGNELYGALNSTQALTIRKARSLAEGLGVPLEKVLKGA